MNTIIEKINNLYEVMQAKDAELSKRITQVKIQLADLDNIKNTLNKRETNLNDRELKLGKIENAVVLKKEAEGMMMAAEEERNNIAKQRSEFTAWTEKERADIAQCRKGVDSSIEVIKEREAQIEQEKKQLALDKLTYRENIIREIGKMTSANT